jgi:hypothetical protein
MTTQEKKLSEITLEVIPNRINQISVGYNKDEFLMVLDYNDKNNDETIRKNFTAILPLNSIQKIIEGLFDCGKAYQKQYGIDIGFGDVKEE